MQAVMAHYWKTAECVPCLAMLQRSALSVIRVLVTKPDTLRAMDHRFAPAMTAKKVVVQHHLAAWV
jgi:hypothetical protein